MKTFLHVGCGQKHKDKTTIAFNTVEWNELRLDIDPLVKPDILGTMTDMSSVPDASVDALFSSHNIEHLYPHEVPMATSEFFRVLKPDGFVILTCPDLQAVCALIADDKLLETMYESPAGPIAPIDILFGYRPSMQKGNLYMAHRSGFTRRVLAETFQQAGFKGIASVRAKKAPDLWIAASKLPLEDMLIQKLASEHFPRHIFEG